MPAAVPLLKVVGGVASAANIFKGGDDKEGSSDWLPAAAGLAGAGASLWGANQDRKTAQQNQQMSAQERAQALQFINQQTQQAQDYLGGSLAPMQQALNQGYGGALQALGGSFAPRMQAITQSSQDAQRFQLGALPLIQQALMGVPMDMSQITPHIQKAQMPYNPNIATNFVNQYGPK